MNSKTRIIFGVFRSGLGNGYIINLDGVSILKNSVGFKYTFGQYTPEKPWVPIGESVYNRCTAVNISPDSIIDVPVEEPPETPTNYYHVAEVVLSDYVKRSLEKIKTYCVDNKTPMALSVVDKPLLEEIMNPFTKYVSLETFVLKP